MNSPYTERYNRTFTISMTERQYKHLQNYCIKNRVSLAAAMRDGFFTLHPIPETDEEKE